MGYAFLLEIWLFATKFSLKITTALPLASSTNLNPIDNDKGQSIYPISTVYLKEMKFKNHKRLPRNVNNKDQPQ